jgi:hypothetical protein
MTFDTTWWDSNANAQVSLKCYYTSGANTCYATAPISISSCKSTYYTNKVITPIVLNSNVPASINLNMNEYFTASAGVNCKVSKIDLIYK